MSKKQRISDLEKYAVMSTALFYNFGNVLVGAAQLLPIVGVLFVWVDFFVSLLGFLGFTAWYIKIGAGVKRMWIRICFSIFLLLLEMVSSSIPYGGAILSGFVMIGFTLSTYLLIRSVQKEDRLTAEAEAAELQKKAMGAIRRV